MSKTKIIVIMSIFTCMQMYAKAHVSFRTLMSEYDVVYSKHLSIQKPIKAPLLIFTSPRGIPPQRFELGIVPKVPKKRSREVIDTDDILRLLTTLDVQDNGFFLRTGVDIKGIRMNPLTLELEEPLGTQNIKFYLRMTF